LLISRQRTGQCGLQRRTSLRPARGAQLDWHEERTAVLEGLRVRRPRATVDDADLPEHARLDDREGQLRAVRGPDHDLDPAGDDQDQGVARITCGKQHLTAAHGPEPGRPDPYLLWLENHSGRS
jgi:hypothetical protein